VVARFLTTMTWLPVVAPALAEAVTTFAFDEVTVREANGHQDSKRLPASW
jgi:hypothetical protein